MRFKEKIRQPIEIGPRRTRQHDCGFDAHFIHGAHPRRHLVRRLDVGMGMNVDGGIARLGRMVLGNDEGRVGRPVLQSHRLGFPNCFFIAGTLLGG